MLSIITQEHKDAYLVNGLASDASAGVQVLVTQGVGVGIGDPGHLTLSSSHVRGGHVNAGTKEGLLGKLNSESKNMYNKL